MLSLILIITLTSYEDTFRSSSKTIPFLKHSWEQFFGSTNKIIHDRDRTSIYDTAATNNYYIIMCYFKESNGNGVIYIISPNEICTLIEESAFKNCRSDNDGGSVYYECSQAGQFVQQRTCYFASKSSGSYMAFYQNVKSSSSYKNYAYEVSVSKCGESETSGIYTFSIKSGDLLFSNNNISYNKCRQYSSFYNFLSGSIAICNFSTFRENIQTRADSLFLDSYSDSINQTVSHCNIIGNTCGKYSILFTSQYTTNVDNCIFLNNTAKTMFYVLESSSYLIISDSYIESNSTSGNVILTNTKINSDFNSLFHQENCFMHLTNLYQDCEQQGRLRR